LLPYLQPPVLHLGPIAVSAFGLLLCAAVLTSLELASRRARVMQLAPSDVTAFTTWVVVPALVLAHLVHALWHRHAVVERDPSYLVDITSGSASSEACSAQRSESGSGVVSIGRRSCRTPTPSHR
jgi:prolipoprotein diacylglyceryltransferase